MKLEIGAYCIRDWELSDADAICRYADNPKIARNLRDAFPSPYGKADAESFLSMVRAQKPRRVFAITARNEAIGSIGLLPGAPR